MTTNEILRADFLDILFENRNREYGAYALRRGYNKRLMLALISGMSLLLVFILASALKKSDASHTAVTKERDQVVIRSIQLPQDKPKDPEKPKKFVI